MCDTPRSSHTANPAQLSALRVSGMSRADRELSEMPPLVEDTGAPVRFTGLRRSRNNSSADEDDNDDLIVGVEGDDEEEDVYDDRPAGREIRVDVGSDDNDGDDNGDGTGLGGLGGSGTLDAFNLMTPPQGSEELEMLNLQDSRFERSLDLRKQHLGNAYRHGVDQHHAGQRRGGTRRLAHFGPQEPYPSRGVPVPPASPPPPSSPPTRDSSTVSDALGTTGSDDAQTSAAMDDEDDGDGGTADEETDIGKVRAMRRILERNRKVYWIQAGEAVAALHRLLLEGTHEQEVNAPSCSSASCRSS